MPSGADVAPFSLHTYSLIYLPTQSSYYIVTPKLPRCYKMDDIPPPPPYTIHDPTSIRLGQSPAHHGEINSVLSQREQRVHDRLYLSGAAYFAMRPSTPRNLVDVLHYHMVFWPGATPDRIPFPQPDRNMRQRDVDDQDWAAFIIHLISNHDAIQQTQAQGMNLFRGKSGQEEPSPTHNPTESMSLEQDCLQEVTTEWNKGFFIPRGLKIMLRIQAGPPAMKDFYGMSHEGADSPWNSVPFRYQANDRKSLGKALHKAISKNDMVLTCLLLEAGADVNARPMCAPSALSVAIKLGNSAVVHMLLEKGPDLEVTAPAGPTPLYEAVTKGDSESVALLLGCGANANAKPPGAQPALYSAASSGRLDILNLLLEAGANVDGTPPGGASALYQAAEKKDLPLMRLLLNGKANIENKPPGGAPALYRAVSNRNRDVVKLLLEYGANVDAKTPGGDSAVHLATSRGDYDLARMLLGQPT
jgi:ankyrin repeat protein